MKNNKTFLRVIKIYLLGTFLTLGLILSYLGVRININTFKDRVETVAKIESIKSYDTEDKTGTYAYITYVVNGHTYSDIELDYYAKGMEINDEVIIYYSESNPNTILSNQVRTLQLGTMFMGFGMVIIGGLGIFKSIKK